MLFGGHHIISLIRKCWKKCKREPPDLYKRTSLCWAFVTSQITIIIRRKWGGMILVYQILYCLLNVDALLFSHLILVHLQEVMITILNYIRRVSISLQGSTLFWIGSSMIGIVYLILLLMLDSFNNLLDEHWTNYHYDWFVSNWARFTGCTFFLKVILLLILKFSRELGKSFPKR